MYGMCKLTELSVNHAGKCSKDCFRAAVFVDTLAGKLDMWLCIAEPVQLNLSKMELGGNIYFFFYFISISMCCVVSLFPPPFIFSPLCISFFLSVCLTK